MSDASASSVGGMTTPDEAWAELNLHLTRSRGLCLVFVYAADSRALMTLRTRLEDEWTTKAVPLSLIRPEAPEHAAHEVMQALEEEVRLRPQLRVPVWLQLTAHDWRLDKPVWETSRHDVLYRLNEWRAWLQQSLRRPLIVALPLAWIGKVAEVAPDLWHVRTMSVRLDIGARALAMDLARPWSRFPMSGSDVEVAETMPVGEGDMALAREGIERARLELVEGGDAIRLDLARRLTEFGHALLRRQDIAEAIDALAEAEGLYESLSAASGDARSFVSERIDAATLLGEAYTAAGKPANALASYVCAGDLLNVRSGMLDQLKAAATASIPLLFEEGRILQQQGRYEEALALYEGKARELESAGAFDLPMAPLVNMTALLKMRAADMLALLGRRGDAIARYRRMVDLLTQRVVGEPGDLRMAILLTSGLRSLEDLLGAAAPSDGPSEALRVSLDHLQQQAEIREPQRVEELALALEHLAQSRLRRVPEEASPPPTLTQPLAQALALRRLLAQAFPDQDRYQAALVKIQAMVDAHSISSASQHP